MWRELIKKIFNKTNKSNNIHTRNFDLPVIALIALKKWELPSKDKIKEFLENKYGERIFINNWKEDIGTFDLQDSQVIITLMPNSIEWSELEDSFHRAWYFEKAKEKLKGHKAHLIISINGGVNSNPLKKSILLSKAISGIIEQNNTIGVFWYNTKMIRDSEEFYQKCINMNTNIDKLPIELWIDIRFRMNSSFKEDIYTVGMDKLGFHNIELMNSRVDSYILYIFVYELCSNIISSNKEFNEGEFIVWDNLKFKATYKEGNFTN
ncbi:MAG: hypothetical protein ACRC2K_11450, partial [Clostridium sp.]